LRRPKPGSLASNIESLRLQDRRREDAITQLRDLGFSMIELQERRSACGSGSRAST
jgi:hypothetical protein